MEKQFIVVMSNLNYNVPEEEALIEPEKMLIDLKKVLIDLEKGNINL